MANKNNNTSNELRLFGYFLNFSAASFIIVSDSHIISGYVLLAISSVLVLLYIIKAERNLHGEANRLAIHDKLNHLDEASNRVFADLNELMARVKNAADEDELNRIRQIFENEINIFLKNSAHTSSFRSAVNKSIETIVGAKRASLYFDSLANNIDNTDKMNELAKIVHHAREEQFNGVGGSESFFENKLPHPT